MLGEFLYGLTARDAGQPVIEPFFADGSLLIQSVNPRLYLDPPRDRLMLLAGFTGQFSIGHAAFLGTGAYTQAVLANMGVPFPIALAAADWNERINGLEARGHWLMHGFARDDAGGLQVHAGAALAILVAIELVGE